MSLCQPELGHRGRHRPGKPTRIPEPKTRGEGTKTTQNSSFLYKIHKIQTRENYIQKKEDTKRAELSCLHPYRKVSCAGAGAGSRGHRPPWRVPPVPSPVAGHPAPAAFLLRRQRLRLLGTCRGERIWGYRGSKSPELPHECSSVLGRCDQLCHPLPITVLSGTASSSTSSSSPSKNSSSSSAANRRPNVTTGTPANGGFARVAPCRWELGRGIGG